MPDTVEVVAVLFSLAAVWLTVREKIICWPVGLIAVVAYGKGAPLSAGLYAVFRVMATSGAVRWQRRYRGRAAPAVLEPA